MPELPEVETIRRQMEHALKGVKIVDVQVLFGKKLVPPAQKFIAGVKGTKFIGFSRRAKLLLLHLSNDHTIITHLKMTGKFLLKPHGEKPGLHTHIIFTLDNGKDLWFDDVRKFGYLKLVNTEELDKALEKFGPEPLDAKFSEEIFANCIGKRKKRIKPLLMEPSCIAGVGNIYADEALWRARIRPTRYASSLTAQEIRELYDGIIVSLKESLKHRGASADNYRDLYDEEGESVPYLKAYGKAKCPRCHGAMKKIWIGARSAHYCPTCQK